MELLTTREVANILRLKNEAQVCALIHSKQLRGINRASSRRAVWLIEREDLERFIRSRATIPERMHASNAPSLPLPVKTFLRPSKRGVRG